MKNKNMKKTITMLLCMFLVGASYAVGSPVTFDNDDGAKNITDIFPGDYAKQVTVTAENPITISYEATHLYDMKIMVDNPEVSDVNKKGPESAVTLTNKGRSAKEDCYECSYFNYSLTHLKNLFAFKSGLSENEYASSWFLCRK